MRDGAVLGARQLSVPEPIYDRLKRELTAGIFPPGTALVETQLAERYSVSRSPVRDALRQLEHDGLVERAGRSLRVRYFTAEQIYELYELRGILEGAAARAAAERHTTFDAAQLRDLLQRLEASALDLHERVRMNRAFHAAIWRASHNSMLIEALDRLYANSVVHMNTTLAAGDRWRTSLREHREMVDAIIHRDGATAERLAVQHLDEARDIRLRAISPL